MKKTFNHLFFIKQLLKYSPRQHTNEIKTAEFLMMYLDQQNITYQQHKFLARTPHFKKSLLIVDGKKLACDACGMVSGKIHNKNIILSSLLSSSICQNDANINFNPKCITISNSNHYFAPAISVDHNVLYKILKAKKVQGEILVEKLKHTAINILVGNTINPEVICFAHYDSIKTGAIDNASGVSIIMSAILKNQKSLKNVLYVFSANEELSYNKPVYWGYGFRVFEKKYFKQMENAKKIITIDSVGNGKTEIIKNKPIIKLGFPIININKWRKKIIFITGDFDHLMTVYHSDIDDGRGLSKKYLNEATDILIQQIFG